MEFTISEEHKQLQEQSRRLAADFATRAGMHDREASNPVENYAALRREGFYGLNVPRGLRGEGVGLLGYSLAARVAEMSVDLEAARLLTNWDA